tara:strand:+ start:459 stop:746 length:288 start_codon:yes stop_codon:yes gene_type:complete
MLGVVQQNVDRESVKTRKRLRIKLMNRSVEYDVSVYARTGGGLTHYRSNVVRNHHDRYPQITIQSANHCVELLFTSGVNSSYRFVENKKIWMSNK